MQTIALCDDEVYFLESLKTGVSRYLSERGVEAELAEFTSGEALLDAEPDFDIVLMDLHLPKKNGIEVAEAFRDQGKSSKFIFVTSYGEYALQAFELDAVHYLLKPVTDEKLFHALDKALCQTELGGGQTLLISKDGCVQRIFIGDILYCEAMNHRTFIHTASASYDYFGTLEALRERLDQRFYQCHRSYIVNLQYVISKDKDTVTVSCGDRVLVSRRKQQELTQRLLSFFRKEVL